MKKLGETFSELDKAIIKLHHEIVILCLIVAFGTGFVVGLFIGLLI